MYARDLQKELLEASKAYPVVTVMGPRQSGKTTLVQLTFPQKPYVNLEEPDIRERALLDPRSFLESYPQGVILDEIQRVPALLSYIQVIVDKRNEKGLFIVTGSHQMELHEAITQSLAGRTALLTLLPLSLSELSQAGFDLSLDEALLRGGYPRIFKDHLNPTKAYSNYFHTYVEKDLRQLIQVKDLTQFQKFVRLCAGRIGGLLNLEGIGNEVGVSSHTIKQWISILEASYITIRLQPFFENFGKRLIKAPKLYFTDVGLAAYLLGIETTTQMARDPLRGHLIENLILLELMKSRLNEGLDAQLYYLRDTHGHEIDFVFQKGHELVPIEVKASQTFNKSFVDNLLFFKKLIGDRLSSGFVVYTGIEKQWSPHYTLLPYTQACSALRNN